MTKEKSYSSMTVFILSFLLIFNFIDIVIYSSTSLDILIPTIIMFLVPLIYAIFHINIDEEALPRYIKYLGVMAATTYLFSQILDSLMYIIIFFTGEKNMYFIWAYKYQIFLLFILLLYGLKKIKLNEKVSQYTLNTLFAIFILYNVLFTFILYLPIGEANTLVAGSFGLKYLMEIFLPLMFLIFVKIERRSLRDGLINTGTLYIILALSLTILASVLNVKSANHLVFNSYFIEFLNINLNSFLATTSLLLSIVINVVMAVWVYLFVQEYSIETNKENQKVRTSLVSNVTAIVFFGIIILLGQDAFSLQNISHDLYLVTQVVLVVSIVLFSFYLGFKKYITPVSKLLLFILSTFPIIYVFIYLYLLNSNTIRVFGEVIRQLNRVFLIFSFFVLMYYTIETITLWYAYTKRLKIEDLEQTPLEKYLHIYVMIPCMNEDLVIGDTVRSVLNNDYPNLKVFVINDASEDNTAREVQKIEDSRLHLFNRTKPNAQIGKGEALNWTYYQLIEQINEDNIPHEDVLITIIDADTDVYSDYFHNVNYVFNSRRETTGLQSKVRVIDLERDSAQDLEFSEIINSSQSLRNIVGTVAFGGNGQFCRLSTLEELNEKPWSDSLVEDFDLSTRLYLKLGNKVKNIQVNDISIRQTGIKKDNRALVKQRVRWAQGNVQSFKYVVEIVKSKLLKKRQKIELIATLIKPWLMAIEYVILIYTLVLLVDIIILDGISRAIILIVSLFAIMALYILTINLVWSILYNYQKPGKIKVSYVISDLYSLTKFLFTLTQIYPQSIIRFFKSENGWDKTKRQK